MIGADTSFIIDFFQGEKNAVDWMEKNKESLCLCENVVYEFLCGNLKEDEKNLFLAFVSQFEVFSFDRNAAFTSSKIYRKSKIKGKFVAHPDAMIAGTYASHGIKKIVTKNIKHFNEMTGIIAEKF